MDTGNGHFKMLDGIQELEERTRGMARHGGIFTVGEEIELKGSRFRIKSIKPNELRLKLLPLKKIP